MYRFLFPILIIFSIISAQTDGDVVKNVTAAQRTDGSKLVDITYDLEDDNGTYTSFTINVTADWPGMHHNFSLNNCYGDVWENVLPGNGKSITCQLGTNYETQYLSGEYIVNVHAEGNSVSQLPDSFEMVEINAQDASSLDYNYEMMKYEVTTTQYVEFLNDKISQATSIIYNDHDGWPGQDGGESFNRQYTFEDDSFMVISYSNPGGCYPGSSIENNCNQYMPSDEPGYGFIYGYFDTTPSDSTYNSSKKWLKLMDVTDERNHPKIQFTSNNICTGNIGDCDGNEAFFISEGHGNHPVVSVTPVGADAFADHYGLRLPNSLESSIPFFGLEASLEDNTLIDETNYDLLIEASLTIASLTGMDPFNGYNYCDFIFCAGCNWDCNLYPVGSSEVNINGIHDLAGNASEIVFSDLINENSYIWKPFGGSTNDIDFSMHMNSGSLEEHLSFRCVRTLAD